VCERALMYLEQMFGTVAVAGIMATVLGLLWLGVV
jgi:hypothetical protein